MPRRYYDYVDRFRDYHLISTLGSYLMGVGFVIVAVYLLHSLYRGRPAPRNPWGGASLEWETDTPPIHHNFERTPAVHDPYDFSGLTWDAEIRGYVRRGGEVTTR